MSETPYLEHCGKCGAHRIDNQIGLEASPAEYVESLVAVFREVRRVLRSDGSAWINLGDSYAANRGYQVSQTKHQTHDYGNSNGSMVPLGCKPKDLIGIPWMVAFALRADGWWLRSDIIWNKPNPMPASVTDRPTTAHEYLFLLSKSARYYYDAVAIAEPAETFTHHQRYADSALHYVKKQPGQRKTGMMGCHADGTRNKRSVWTIATEAFPESHFAVFPTKLVEPCIKAGTSERGVCAACGSPWGRVVEKTRTFNSGSGRAGNLPSGKNGPLLQGGGETIDIRRGPCVTAETTGWQPSCACNAAVVPATILDCFAGAGTTGLVADRLGRDAVLIELNPDYAKMAETRLQKDAGLFSSIEIAGADAP